MKQNYSLSNLIYRKTIENQGCTMSLRGQEPSSGYMVGLKGYELRINVLDFTPEHVDHVIRKNLPKLYEDKVYLGSWINGDQVYLDLSVNLQNKAVALAYGVLNGQICIWDILRKVEIYQLQEV